MKISGKIRAKILTVAAAMAILLTFAIGARANIGVNPSSVKFGNQSVGSSSASITVTITNNNRQDITIARVSYISVQFFYSGPSLPVTLSPGHSLTGSVTFKPPAAQNYSGILEFTRGNGSKISVALSGTGQTSTVNAVAPTISSQPASAKIAAGQTATFNVAATGTTPMNYVWMKNGAAISGATSSTYTTPAETTTDNNAKFTVTVGNSAGSATSNAATLTVSASSLLLNSSSSSLSFGNVTVSSNSAQNVTLTNAGNSSVTISNITVSGSGFNASCVSSGLILAQGQKATLSASFAPAATGSVTGSISVASNATNSPDSISLSGTGIAGVSHFATLTWTSSTSKVIGYNTYFSAVTGGPYTKLTSTPDAATSYTDTSVQAGKTYYFVVTSVDSSNVESVYSAEASALIP
jgi:hypothetical protein